MRPRKLTDAQAAHVRDVIQALRKLPSVAELCRQTGLTRKALLDIADEKTYKDVPRGMYGNGTKQSLIAPLTNE